ncbi:hypothetical protein C4K18_4036 [Pseudomonas chlororaphis subsp. aurantiaca]|nr:hypothetical protein C4K18_4036 [Pseudomonas chlororaphis subsp. aurantiaca]
MHLQNKNEAGAGQFIRARGHAKYCRQRFVCHEYGSFCLDPSFTAGNPL